MLHETIDILQSYFDKKNAQGCLQWLMALEENYTQAYTFLHDIEDDECKQFVSTQIMQANILKELEKKGIFNVNDVSNAEKELFKWLFIPANRQTAEAIKLPDLLIILNREESKTVVKLYNQVKASIDLIEKLKDNSFTYTPNVEQIQQALNHTEAPKIFKRLNVNPKYHVLYTRVLSREYLNIIFSNTSRESISPELRSKIDEQKDLAIKQWTEHLKSGVVEINDADIHCLTQYCQYMANSNPTQAFSPEIVELMSLHLNSDKVSDSQLRMIRTGMKALLSKRPDISILAAIMEPLAKKLLAIKPLKQEDTLENEILLKTYLKYTLSAKVTPSETALLWLTEKLQENEAHDDLRHYYKNFLLDSPRMVEKLVFTPDTLYNLSTKGSSQTFGASFNSREGRALVAITSIPQDKIQESAQLLACELVTRFASELGKIDAILEMLDTYSAKGAQVFKEALETELNTLLADPTQTSSAKKLPTKEALKKLSLSPHLVEKAWFTKGRVLLARSDLDAAAIVNITECFKKAGIKDEGERASEKTSSIFSFSRESSVSTASQFEQVSFSANEWKNIATLLLKTTLPEHEAVWEFFEKNAQLSDTSETLINALLKQLNNTETMATLDPEIVSKAMQLVAACLPRYTDDVQAVCISTIGTVFERLPEVKFSKEGFQDLLILGLDDYKNKNNIQAAADYLAKYVNDFDAGFNEWIKPERTYDNNDMLFKFRVWLTAQGFEDIDDNNAMQRMMEETVLPLDAEMWNSIIHQGKSWRSDDKMALLTTLTASLKQEYADEMLGQNLAKIEKTFEMISQWDMTPEQINQLGLKALFSIKCNILNNPNAVESLKEITVLKNINAIESTLLVKNLSILDDKTEIANLLRAFPDGFEEASFSWINAQEDKTNSAFIEKLFNVLEHVNLEERKTLLDISKDLLPNEVLSPLFEKLNEKNKTIFIKSSEQREAILDEMQTLDHENKRVFALAALQGVKPEEILDIAVIIANKMPLLRNESSDTYWNNVKLAITYQLSENSLKETTFSELIQPKNFSRLKVAYDDAVKKKDIKAQEAISDIVKQLFLANPPKLMNQLSEWDREDERKFLIDTLKLDAPTIILDISDVDKRYIKTNMETYERERGLDSTSGYERVKAYYPNSWAARLWPISALWTTIPDPPSGTGVKSRYNFQAKPAEQSLLPSLVSLATTKADLVQQVAKRAKAPDQRTTYLKLSDDIIATIRVGKIDFADPWHPPISQRERSKAIAEDGISVQALKREREGHETSLKHELDKFNDHDSKKTSGSWDTLQIALQGFITTSIRLALLDNEGGNLNDINQYIGYIKNITRSKPPEGITEFINKALDSSSFSAALTSMNEVEATIVMLKGNREKAIKAKDVTEKNTVERQLASADMFLLKIYGNILKTYPEDKIIKEKNAVLLAKMSGKIEEFNARVDHVLTNIGNVTKDDDLLQRIEDVQLAHQMCGVLKNYYHNAKVDKAEFLESGIAVSIETLEKWEKKHMDAIFAKVVSSVMKGDMLTKSDRQIVKVCYKINDDVDALKTKFNAEAGVIARNLDSILNRDNQKNLGDMEGIRNLVKTGIKWIALDEHSDAHTQIKNILDKVNEAIKVLDAEEKAINNDLANPAITVDSSKGVTELLNIDALRNSLKAIATDAKANQFIQSLVEKTPEKVTENPKVTHSSNPIDRHEEFAKGAVPKPSTRESLHKKPRQLNQMHS